MHEMLVVLWIAQVQDYLRLNVQECISDLCRFQMLTISLAARRVAWMTGDGIQQPPTPGHLHLLSAKESSDDLAVQHQMREVTSSCKPPRVYRGTNWLFLRGLCTVHLGHMW